MRSQRFTHLHIAELASMTMQRDSRPGQRPSLNDEARHSSRTNTMHRHDE